MISNGLNWIKEAFCSPNAVIIPNMTQNNPPTTGSGIIIKIAPNLLITPCNTIINAAHWITRLLPICVCVCEQNDNHKSSTYNTETCVIL